MSLVPLFIQLTCLFRVCVGLGGMRTSLSVLEMASPTNTHNTSAQLAALMTMSVYPSREWVGLKMRRLVRYLTKGAAKGDPRHMRLLYHSTHPTTTITTVVVFNANFRSRNLQELLSPG